MQSFLPKVLSIATTLFLAAISAQAASELLLFEENVADDATVENQGGTPVYFLRVDSDHQPSGAKVLYKTDNPGARIDFGALLQRGNSLNVYVPREYN
jgi:hypothetical protein